MGIHGRLVASESRRKEAKKKGKTNLGCPTAAAAHRQLTMTTLHVLHTNTVTAATHAVRAFYWLSTELVGPFKEAREKDPVIVTGWRTAAMRLKKGSSCIRVTRWEDCSVLSKRKMSRNLPTIDEHWPKIGWNILYCIHGCVGRICLGEKFLCFKHPTKPYFFVSLQNIFVFIHLPINRCTCEKFLPPPPLLHIITFRRAVMCLQLQSKRLSIYNFMSVSKYANS